MGGCVGWSDAFTVHEGPRRTATAEGQRQNLLSTKGREGPRRTATAELQRLHLFPRRTRRATENGNCRIGNCRRSTAKPFIHEGPRRTATATAELQRLHLFPRRTRRATEKGHGERQLQNCNGYTFLFAEDIFGAVDCGRRTGVSGEKRAMAARDLLHGLHFLWSLPNFNDF